MQVDYSTSSCNTVVRYTSSQTMETFISQPERGWSLAAVTLPVYQFFGTSLHANCQLTGSLVTVFPISDLATAWRCN